jgi:hypothetical protein
MSITIKTKYWVIGILVLLLGVFFLGRYQGRKKADRLHATIENALSDKINSYVVEINDVKTYVSTKEQEISTLRQALQRAELSREEIRKLHLKDLQEMTRLKFTIDTLLTHVSNNGTVVIVNPGTPDSKPCVLLPFSFSKNDEWLDLYGLFRAKDSLSIGLKMRINADIYTEYDKKANTYNVTVSSTNPYLKVAELKSMKFNAVRPKKFGIGIQMGYGFGFKSVLPTPYVGVGLQYSMIRF